MRSVVRQWGRGLVVLVAGSMLLFAGCAGTMMGSDQGMMKDKGMMKDEGMMKKEGGTMKEEKGMMEKKQ